MKTLEQIANKYFTHWKMANELYGKDAVYVKALRKLWWEKEQEWIDTTLDYPRAKMEVCREKAI